MSSPDRLLAVQSIVTDWWNRWTLLYLPTLVHQSKWFDKRGDRAAAVGDVVYIKDLNPIRGQWNIGEIIEVRENPNGFPINVLIRYKATSFISTYA